jgi:acyl carrier protein
MADQLEQRILQIVQDVLREKSDQDDVLITADDSMETVPAWDSLSFMSVFLAINEAFGVDPDFDDAIHYTSVRSLHAFLKDQAA